MSDGQRGRVRIEAGHKQVRGYVGGHLVVETIRPVLVWEVPYYPAYYVPAEDVRVDLTDNGRTSRSPSRGDAHHFDVKVADRVVTDAGWRHPDSPIEELRGLVRFEWDAVDEWLEEDEPVYVHPRSPYTRVDILSSSRHVRVEVDGVTLAESRKPTILFETGLPPRYYLPLSDVRLDLFQPSTHDSHCPYKGTANYWSVEVGGRVLDDLMWAYRTPLPESQKIAGLACFYNEKVDLYVDGVRQERPQTKFS